MNDDFCNSPPREWLEALQSCQGVEAAIVPMPDGSFAVGFENAVTRFTPPVLQTLLSSGINMLCFDQTALFSAFTRTGIVADPWSFVDMLAVTQFYGHTTLQQALDTWADPDDQPPSQVHIPNLLLYLQARYGDPTATDVPTARTAAAFSQQLAFMQLRGIPMRHSHTAFPGISQFSGPAGRISYNSPPVQSYGIEERSQIVAYPGQSLWSVDIVSADLQSITALLPSLFPVWTEILKSANDPYSFHEDRTLAKLSVLSALNGAGLKRLRELADDRKTADKIWDSPPISELRAAREAFTDPSLPQATSLSGRAVPLILEAKPWKRLGLLAQAATRDILASCMRSIDGSGLEHAALFLVHDEIVFSCWTDMDFPSVIGPMISRNLLLPDLSFRVKGPAENWAQL